MKNKIRLIILTSVLFAGCKLTTTESARLPDQGGGVNPTTIVTYRPVPVRISWAANRERAVNQAGGGYIVYHAKKPGVPLAEATAVNVPYVSGASAPTSVDTVVPEGTNYYRVVAYSALRPPGSSIGAMSSASDEVMFKVIIP
jgi:hypothetical protein